MCVSLPLILFLRQSKSQQVSNSFSLLKMPASPSFPSGNSNLKPSLFLYLKIQTFTLQLIIYTAIHNSQFWFFTSTMFEFSQTPAANGGSESATPKFAEANVRRTTTKTTTPLLPQKTTTSNRTMTFQRIPTITLNPVPHRIPALMRPRCSTVGSAKATSLPSFCAP